MSMLQFKRSRKSLQCSNVYVHINKSEFFPSSMRVFCFCFLLLYWLPLNTTLNWGTKFKISLKKVLTRQTTTKVAVIKTAQRNYSSFLLNPIRGKIFTGAAQEGFVQNRTKPPLYSTNPRLICTGPASGLYSGLAVYGLTAGDHQELHPNYTP